MPVVPSYGSPDEYTLQQRQLAYQPTRGAWPPAAPRGLRPIGSNVFGGNPFGAQPPGVQDQWERGGRVQRHSRGAAAMVFVPDGYERGRLRAALVRKH